MLSLVLKFFGWQVRKDILESAKAMVVAREREEEVASSQVRPREIIRVLPSLSLSR